MFICSKLEPGSKPNEALWELLKWPWGTDNFKKSTERQQGLFEAFDADAV